MIALFSYPELFGVADNNPFGLKVFAFLKLSGLEFEHDHIFDSRTAPRGQLPYIVDGGEVVGDSDTIIAHLGRKYRLDLDAALTPAQLHTGLLIRRMLDDLYWVMSYSRWADERYWPLFRAAILETHPQVTAAAMDAARDYNAKRYYYQGIGRYAPEQVYARGLADLEVLAAMLGPDGCLFGPGPSSIDAGIYGFLANIHFYPIDTPLKQFLAAHANLVGHTERIHALVMR